MEKPQLEFAFEIRVKVEAGGIQELGRTEKGLRRIIAINGGNFEGPSIKGTILPGGYDWQLVRTDGVAEIDARYLLKTDDGSLITIVNTGLRHGPAQVMEKLSQGVEVDPALYYFRTIPVFETSDPKYKWLTGNIFIATGIRKTGEVIIRVWKVL